MILPALIICSRLVSLAGSLPNLYALCVANNASKFAAYIQDVGLEPAIEYGGVFHTVFAPTDRAFDEASEAKKRSLNDTEEEVKIVTQHIVTGHLYTSNISYYTEVDSWGGVLRLRRFKPLKQVEAKVYVQGAEVVKGDILGSNGMLHVIDSVLPVYYKSLRELLETMDNLSSFKLLLLLSGEIHLLENKNSAHFSLFAPSNAAFNKLSDAEWRMMLSSHSNTKEVADYHIVSGLYYKYLVKAQLKLATLLPGNHLSISLKAGEVKLNNATIKEADLDADNGIVHVIDEVLIPPSINPNIVGK